MITFHCQAASCLFDKTPTAQIIIFEIFVLLATVLSLYFFSKKIVNWRKKFITMLIAVIIFEFFTHPLWYNYKMGSWAYIYKDVSWILALGWAVIFFSVVELTDIVFAKISKVKRFGIYLVGGLLFGLLGEALVVNLGIRSYAPEAVEVINNNFMPLLNVPWVALYYMPVFMALVVGCYKYWQVIIDKELSVPVRKRRWLRDFIIAFVGVFLFELMIEPMVINAKLPEWSYVYRDVSILMTGGWVLIIWLAVSLVDKYFIGRELAERFFLYLAIVSLITLPIEAFLMRNGFRLYEQSAVDNFSGLTLPFTSVPIEVVVAIPFYLALVIGFNRYWMYMLDNK